MAVRHQQSSLIQEMSTSLLSVTSTKNLFTRVDLYINFLKDVLCNSKVNLLFSLMFSKTDSKASTSSVLFCVKFFDRQKEETWPLKFPLVALSRFLPWFRSNEPQVYNWTDVETSITKPVKNNKEILAVFVGCPQMLSLITDQGRDCQEEYIF